MYVGAIAPTDLHAHHASQIGWALGGATIRIEDSEGTIVEAEAMLVPSDAPHAIRSTCPSAVMLYVDPESREGMFTRSLGAAARSAQAWSQASERLPRAPRAPRTILDAQELADSALGALACPRSPADHAMHPAVRRTIAHLAGRLDFDLRLNAIAAKVGISAGRLRHVFAHDVGIPLRRYLLWRRLMVAADGAREGLSLTEAAHHAGFADSAHLTKTFRSTFGLAPSEAMADIEWVVATT